MTDDRPLVESAIRGELSAFNQLMKSWHKRIFNFAYRYLNDYDEASEVTQQTFIKAYGAIGTLKDPGRFRAWLYIIASNGCRAHSRRAGRYATESMNANGAGEGAAWGQLAASENPEKQLLSRDWEKLLKRALAQIPEDQRLVIIMKEYEGLMFHEIAEVLSESENTVKSRMYYGLKALRKVLTKWNITKEAIQYEE
ncbi:MAG: RNA polymerase sigma factor [Cytophagales bacterium]|nr:RNA polymerase sigma factor [Cytophagales bacterium]